MVQDWWKYYNHMSMPWIMGKILIGYFKKDMIAEFGLTVLKSSTLN